MILSRDFFAIVAVSFVLAFAGRADIYFYGVKPNLVLAVFSAFSAEKNNFWPKVLGLLLAVFVLSFGFGGMGEFLPFFLVMFFALLAGCRLPGKKILNVATIAAVATLAVYAASYYGGSVFPPALVFQEVFYNVVLAAAFYAILSYGQKIGTYV